MTSSSLSPLLPDCVAESSFFSAGCITCSPDPSRLYLTRLFDTCLFALVALFGFSPAVGTALLLPAVGTAHSSWVLGFHGCFSLSFVRPFRVLLLTCTLFHPSLAAIGLLFRAPSTRCILLLLPLSWLTDSLFLSPVVGFLFCASSTRCRLLLLCRFLVSVRACLSRSLASSGLTTSSSRHSRAASCATSRLFCSSSSILW